jgi:hypothetical protein
MIGKVKSCIFINWVSNACLFVSLMACLPGTSIVSSCHPPSRSQPHPLHPSPGPPASRGECSPSHHPQLASIGYSGRVIRQVPIGFRPVPLLYPSPYHPLHMSHPPLHMPSTFPIDEKTTYSFLILSLYPHRLISIL